MGRLIKSNVYYRLPVVNNLFACIMKKAVFFDRDGTILSLVYDKNHGIVRTPLSPREVEFMPHIVSLCKKIKSKGYKLFIISNQPDIGLGRITQKTFNAIQNNLESYFAKYDIAFDGYYYCFHHPYAKIAPYKKMCVCRKPNPGLLFQAAKEHNIDLINSWMIGDGVNDVLAGHKAGCKTILIANNLESGHLSLATKHLKNTKPDYIVKKLKEILSII